MDQFDIDLSPAVGLAVGVTRDPRLSKSVVINGHVAEQPMKRIASRSVADSQVAVAVVDRGCVRRAAHEFAVDEQLDLAAVKCANDVAPRIQRHVGGRFVSVVTVDEEMQLAARRRAVVQVHAIAVVEPAIRSLRQHRVVVGAGRGGINPGLDRHARAVQAGVVRNGYNVIVSVESRRGQRGPFGRLAQAHRSLILARLTHARRIHGGRSRGLI